MQKVQVGSQELTHGRNTLGCLHIVDGSRSFRPVDENHIEIVELQQLARCFDFDVAGVVIKPSVDQNSCRSVGVEGTLLD